MNPGQELAPGMAASPVTAGQEAVTESRKTLGLSDRQDSTGVGLMETIINGNKKQNKKTHILPHAHQDNEFFRTNLLCSRVSNLACFGGERPGYLPRKGSLRLVSYAKGRS